MLTSTFGKNNYKWSWQQSTEKYQFVFLEHDDAPYILKWSENEKVLLAGHVRLYSEKKKGGKVSLRNTKINTTDLRQRPLLATEIASCWFKFLQNRVLLFGFSVDLRSDQPT